MTSKDHLDFCSKLTGKDLKEPEKSIDDCRKEGETENCVQNGEKEEDPTKEVKTSSPETEAQGSSNEHKSDEINEKEVECKRSASKQAALEQIEIYLRNRNPEGESWPLLETIMQLGNMKEFQRNSDVNVDTQDMNTSQPVLRTSMGHGRNLKP